MMGWTVAPLANTLLLADVGVWGPADADDGVSVLRSTNFLDDGRLDLEKLSLRAIPKRKRQAKLLKPGDIVLERSGGSPRQPVGRVCFFPGDQRQPHSFGNFCQRLRANPRVCEPRYLFWHLFRVHTMGGTLAFQKHTTGIRNLDYSAYLNQPVPLPGPSEQRRIAEILDQAERLRRLRVEADGKAERILPALFIKLFGDPIANPMGWPRKALGDLATLGPQYGANARSAPFRVGFPRYIRITDIRDGGQLTDSPVGIDLSEWEPYELVEGDILFARSGATVGKTYIHRATKDRCVFAGYLIRFRVDPEELLPLVAFAFTQTRAYRDWVQGKRRTAAQPNINGQEYSSLMVPVPDRDLQSVFASAQRRHQAARDLALSSSQCLAVIFTNLLNRAFSGRLTASWREAHMKELLAEMELQSKALAEV